MHPHSGLVWYFLVIMGGLGMSVFPEEAKPVIRVGAEWEKRLGTSEGTRNPTPHEEGELSTAQPEDMKGGEVEEVGKIVTTTGDMDEESRFTSSSAQILIQDIIVCNRDLDLIKQKTNEIEQKIKNMIDVLGRI